MHNTTTSSNNTNTEILLANEHGLHARASAKVVNVLASMQVNGVASCHGRQARHNSVVELMMLCARKGDRVSFSFSGEHAESAKEAIEALNAANFLEQ